MDNTNVTSLLHDGTWQLQEAQATPTPRLDARVLLMAATGWDEGELIARQNEDVSSASKSLYRRYIARRKSLEPIAYIVRHKEFWGLDFFVNPDVLIPRPDSETLIEAIVRHKPDVETVLDLGTGSGCLLAALLHEYPDAFGIGVDRMMPAARVARRNLRALGFQKRSAIMHAHWTDSLKGLFDVIVSNPPYIDPLDFDNLPMSVSNYEPKSALFSANQGRRDYDRILSHIGAHRAKDGVIAIEIGDGQVDYLLSRVKEILELPISVHADLSGVPRVLLLG